MELRRWQGPAVDAAVAATTLAFALGAGLSQNGMRLSPAGVALAFVACGALLLRRRHPVLVLAFTLLVSTLSSAAVEAGGPIFVTFVVALYTAAAEGRLPAAIVLAVVGTLGMIFREVSAEAGTTDGKEENAILVVGWLVAVLAVGGVTWNRRAYLAEVERRAAEAERSRDADGRRRATEERMRIARELHDVLAHNISVINVRAGAALFNLTEASRPGGDGVRPELVGQTVEALTVIRDVCRDAGRELRATLGVLREADEAAPTAPIPGLSRLSDLVDMAGRAGLRVHTTVEGTPRGVPAEVDLAAYRIVQEALTNVARHADTGSVSVRIRYQVDDVVIQVENQGGPARAAQAPGYGIQGMRERASALGGELHAGPRGEGGFEVHVRLPMREHV